MKYSWNINNLINDVKFLKEKLKSTTDNNERNKIMYAISKINSNIIEINLDNNNYEQSLYTADENFSDFANDYSQYIIYKELLDSFRILKFDLNSFDPDDDYFLNTKLSINDYINSIYEFYKSIGGLFFDEFIKAYNNSYFKIYKRENLEDVCGSSYVIPYLNKVYIEQNYNKNTPTCKQIITGVHEYGHAIGGIVNGKRYTEGNYINEIESFFFELLSIDFYSKYFNTNNFYKEAYSNMIDYQMEASGVSDIEKYIEKYIELSYKNKTIAHLDEEEKKEYEYFCNSINLNNTYKYLISYITAVNLYLIYSNSKEKGLNALRSILLSSKDREYESIIKNTGGKSRILEYKNYLDNKIK